MSTTTTTEPTTGQNQTRRATIEPPSSLRALHPEVYHQKQASVGDLLVDRPRRNTLRRTQTGGSA